MKPRTKEEKQRTSKYRDMVEGSELYPDLGITGRRTYHLHHIARYISRIKGFREVLKKELVEFRNNEFGACLVADVVVADPELTKEFGTKWDEFRHHVERFQLGASSLQMKELEDSFMAICNVRNYNPGPI